MPGVVEVQLRLQVHKVLEEMVAVEMLLKMVLEEVELQTLEVAVEQQMMEVLLVVVEVV